jgi:hypothetical protein
VPTRKPRPQAGRPERASRKRKVSRAVWKARSKAAKRSWETRRKREAAKAKARRKKRALRKAGRKVGPKTGPVAPVEAGHYQEGRFFQSGHQLLGYLENRPGIIRVLSAQSWAQPGHVSQRHAPDAETVSRIRELPFLAELRPNSEEYSEAFDDVVEAWELADDGGAEVETEVDADSGGDEA